MRRYLPVPETPEEEALIKAYDDVYEHPDPVEVAEAIERFIATGATAENLAWAVQCTERTLDRLYG